MLKRTKFAAIQVQDKGGAFATDEQLHWLGDTFLRPGVRVRRRDEREPLAVAGREDKGQHPSGLSVVCGHQGSSW